MARAVVLTNEKIWMAGFFDGEGHIGAKRVQRPSGDYWYPVVQLTQKHPNVLYWIQKNWYGSVTLTANHGKWAATTANARNFLEDIRPFLVCKREQADFVLDRPKLAMTEEERQMLHDMKGVDSWRAP